MTALVCHRYGSPDVLEFAELPEPRANEGEVLVRVRAVSVNACGNWIGLFDIGTSFRRVSGRSGG